MKKPIVIAVVIVAAIVTIVGIVSTMRSTDGSGHDMTKMTPAGNNQPATQPAGPNQVIIKNYAFSPKTITVKKGTKVTWTNQDTDHHNVQPDQETADFKAGPLLGKNESYSFTFDKAGTYNYHCSPHPYMKASVVVTE